MPSNTRITSPTRTPRYCTCWVSIPAASTYRAVSDLKSTTAGRSIRSCPEGATCHRGFDSRFGGPIWQIALALAISFHQDLSNLIVALLGETDAAAPELHRRLTESGVALPRLAFDGLLVSLEVTGIVCGRYASQPDPDAPATRVYGRGPEAMSASTLGLRTVA